MEKSTLRKMKKMLAMVSAFSCGMMGSLSSYAEVTDDKTSENTFLHSFIDAVNDSVENHFTDENMSLETETISDGMHVEEIEVLEEEEVLDDSHEVDLKAVSSHLVKQFTVDDIEIANEAILTYVLSYYQMSMDDFLIFSKEVMSEAIKNNNPYETIYDVAKTMYDLSLVSNDQKIATILASQGMNYEQLLVSIAVLNHESKGTGSSYCDTYFVTNTACSRSNSYTWIRSGSNIYAQLTSKGQFESYYKGYYKALYGNMSLIGSQAVLDRLFVDVTKQYELYTTPFLGFRSKGSKSGVQLVAGGNKYRNPQPEEDRIHPRGNFSYSMMSLSKELQIKTK